MTHSRKSVEAARQTFKLGPRRFRLKSGRSTRVDVWGPCSKCAFSVRPIWYYSMSSHGPVYLCIPCKDEALDGRAARKGKSRAQDVLDMPPTVVPRSAFESNRRRH